LPATDAQCDDAELEVAANQFLRDPQGQDRTGGADRMAERDRAAVGVDSSGVELRVADAGDSLRCEGLVDLEYVDVGGCNPCLRVRGRGGQSLRLRGFDDPAV
jgi:hypothetical protein